MIRENSIALKSHTFEVKLCDLEHVVVFQDRAEVTRLLKCDVTAGENEIILNKFPEVFDKDSLRVVIKSTCEAVLNEVSYQETYISKEEQEKSNRETEQQKSVHEINKQKLKDEKTELQDKVRQLEQTLKVSTRKIELLEKYIKNVTSTNTLHKMTLSDFLAQFQDPASENEAANNITSLLDFYQDQMTTEEIKKLEIENQIKELKSSLDQIEKKINELSSAPGEGDQSIKVQKQAGVYLEAKENGNVELKFSYLVSSASWTPKYDLRVDSGSLQMTVQYFGMIKQSTTEDWMNAKISLSTAAANVSGEIPELETKYISSMMLQNKAHHSRNAQNKKHKRLGENVNRRANAQRGSYIQSSSSEDEDDDKSVSNASRSDEGASISVPQAEARQGMLSNTFHISSLASIPSDNTPHKVSVASINLKPKFEHVTVPKKAPCAYLKAKVKNSSKFMFLPGPTNVFLDNNFVTKSTMNSVAPNEHFETFLGVDNRVKVEYKPLKRFREQVGIISKYVVWNFRQDIQIENFRDDQIILQLIDQVPNSLDGNIIVKLQQPNLQPIPNPPPEQMPNPYLEKDGIIHWEIDFAPGKNESISIQYTVEFPKNIKVNGLDL